MGGGLYTLALCGWVCARSCGCMCVRLCIRVCVCALTLCVFMCVRARRMDEMREPLASQLVLLEGLLDGPLPGLAAYLDMAAFAAACKLAAEEAQARRTEALVGTCHADTHAVTQHRCILAYTAWCAAGCPPPSPLYVGSAGSMPLPQLSPSACC